VSPELTNPLSKRPPLIPFQTDPLNPFPSLFFFQRTAANLSPSDPEIQYNLAAVLEALEQLEEALKAYTEARDGGIERAEQNIRNCQAKIMAAKLKAANES